MKLPCNVTQDLLPLYHDGVCSEESRRLVEEHLEGCEACKRVLEELNTEALTASVDDADGLKALKKIQRKWVKSMAKAFYKGILIALTLCALVLGIYFATTRWKCIPVPTSVMEVSNVCLMEDGRILYHLNVTDCSDYHFGKSILTEDGKKYFPLMRSLIEPVRRISHNYPPDYELLDVAEENAWQQHWGDGIEITAVYLGRPGNAVLVWEKGMELPPASQELEEYWG
ncbi:MAG: zf-HC2 domain-containing protein [Eubacteriales bacterium]|nr:zf-HC2 domain-containing protein [Eubacteriales bacterium]